MPFPLSVEQKQTAFWVAVWAAFFFLLFMLGPVLTPFVAAAILAYALNPAADRLDRLRLRHLRLPRALSVLIVVTLFCAALLALVLIVVPVLQKEIPLMREQIPTFLARANDTLGPKLQEMGVKVRLDSAGIRKLVSQQMATSGDEIWGAVLNSARIGGTAVLGWLATVPERDDPGDRTEERWIEADLRLAKLQSSVRLRARKLELAAVKRDP